MAEYDRAFWIRLGVPEKAVEGVMEAHEKALAEVTTGLVPEAEVQKRVEEALTEAKDGLVAEEEVQKRVDEAVAGAREGLVAEAEVQERVEEAVAAVREEQGGEAYQRLLAERDMLRAIGGEDFKGVKPKFREQVYALLDRGHRAAPLADQLAAIREKYEEYFVEREQPQRLPRFGAPTRGSMPRGSIGTADQFSQAWGFGARHNG